MLLNPTAACRLRSLSRVWAPERAAHGALEGALNVPEGGVLPNTNNSVGGIADPGAGPPPPGAVQHDHQVGITEYLSPHLLPFHGTIKQRFGDFYVREILPDGTICRLTAEDLLPPVGPLRDRLYRDLAETRDPSLRLKRLEREREEAQSSYQEMQKTHERERSERAWSEQHETQLLSDGWARDEVKKLRHMWLGDVPGSDPLYSHPAAAVAAAETKQQHCPEQAPEWVLCHAPLNRKQRIQAHNTIRTLFHGQLISEAIDADRAQELAGGDQWNVPMDLLSAPRTKDGNREKPFLLVKPARIQLQRGAARKHFRRHSDPRSFDARHREKNEKNEAQAQLLGKAGEASPAEGCCDPEHPPYIRFWMQKANRELYDAAGVLTRHLGMAHKVGTVTPALGFAGTKDKRAVTTQAVTLKRGRRTLEQVWLQINRVVSSFHQLQSNNDPRSWPRPRLRQRHRSSSSQVPASASLRDTSSSPENANDARRQGDGLEGDSSASSSSMDSSSENLEVLPEYTEDDKVRTSVLDALTRRAPFSIRIGKLSYTHQGLRLGDLRGNQFNITLRNVTCASGSLPFSPSDASSPVIDSVPGMIARRSESESSTVDPSSSSIRIPPSVPPHGTSHEKEEEEELVSRVDQAIHSLRTKGYINYFGLQRFGTTNVPTHGIGALVLRSQFERAVEWIMADRTTDNPTARNARIAYRANQLQRAYFTFPKAFVAETAIIGRLVDTTIRKGKDPDWLYVLLSVPRNLRMIFCHAYQSYVWNQCVSERLRRGRHVMVGDYVLAERATTADEWEDTTRDVDAALYGEAEAETEADVDVDVEAHVAGLAPGEAADKDDGSLKDGVSSQEQAADEAYVAYATQQAHQRQVDRDLNRSTMPKVKILTESDDLSQYELSDVLMPLPGYDIPILPDSWYGKALTRILAHDGLRVEDLWGSEWKEFRMRGAYRFMIARPRNVRARVVRYTHAEQNLHVSDEDVALGELAQQWGTGTTHLRDALDSVGSGAQKGAWGPVRREEEEEEAEEEEKEKEKEETRETSENRSTSSLEVRGQGPFYAVQLAFELPTATYATMALRELLKCDTSPRVQRLLTLNGADQLYRRKRPDCPSSSCSSAKSGAAPVSPGRSDA